MFQSRDIASMFKISTLPHSIDSPKLDDIEKNLMADQLLNITIHNQNLHVPKLSVRPSLL